ncbi:hypothetical protein ABXS69_07610 [Actinomyces timonensis]|uniref:Uncharacterized protein n=1 Tax=Actinomyces timonensis TaxID=1288391 RepID=A0AAU8N0F7_9ACTO
MNQRIRDKLTSADQSVEAMQSAATVVVIVMNDDGTTTAAAETSTTFAYGGDRSGPRATDP